MTTFQVDGQNVGQVIHVDAGSRVVYVVVTTPGAEDEKAVRRRAHEFAMKLDSGEPPFHGAAHVVETLVMPSTQSFYGHVVPAGAWVVGLRFSDATWPRISADLDGDVQNKGGGDEMDPFGTAVREKREPLLRARRHETTKASFADTVRAPVPQGTHEITDTELVLVRQAVAEALRPLLLQLQELDSRIRRIVTGIRPPQDPFGAAVRGGPAFEEVEKAARDEFRRRDPVGAAILEKRPPLTLGQGRRFLRDKRRP